MRGKRNSRFLRFCSGPMKKRKGRGIIFLRKSRLSEGVCRGSSKFAIVIIVEHFLEICASARRVIQISITFAERKISVRTAGTPRVIVEILLIFRYRQIVELASEERVRVIELAAVGRFAFSRGRLGKILGRTARKWHWRFFQWEGPRDRWLIYWLGTTDFRRPLTQDRAGHPEHDQSKKAPRAARRFHFAVAKATLVTPTSLQMFKTPMMFL